MRVLAVDDEQPALDELTYLLGRDPRVSAVLGSTSATEGLRLLQDGGVDCVFLDVAMPGLTGLELAHVLRQFRTPPSVVFVTAYEGHAVEAFDLRAVDYVLKPVRSDRLGQAIDRVAEVRQVDPEPSGQRLGTRASESQIPVELGGVIRFIERDEVTHVQAHGDYARLHLPGESHLIRTSLASLEEQWREAGFVRIHRSFLVSLGHVTQIRTDAGRCIVSVGATELAVSRRHTRALRDLVLRRTRS